MKQRTVYCADSLKWLAGKTFKAIITSLPDMDELGCTLGEYGAWMKGAAGLLASTIEGNGCIIFYQTNRRYKGILIDKDFQLCEVFYSQGFNKVFHKIVLRKDPGKTDLYRPAYSNMFCFSQDLRSGRPVPDVISAGKMVHPNGMGLNACQAAIDFIKNNTTADTIVDPFCGYGSILAVANKNGLRAIGVDINPSRTNIAKSLLVE